MTASIRDLISYRLAMLASLNDRSGQAHIKETFGLTLSAWRVLGNIAADGPVSFLALSQRLIIDKGQLSRTVTALADQGYVSALADPHDGRSTQLSLTRSGRALHARALAFAGDRNEAVLSVLTLAERRQLMKILPKLEAFIAIEHATLDQGTAREAEAVARDATRKIRGRTTGPRRSRSEDARFGA